MRKLLTGVAALAAITVAPPAHANPNQGEQCVNWHATTTDNNGNFLVCTHLADSGHIMYWESSIQDRSYRTAGTRPTLTIPMGTTGRVIHATCM
jgi:hypothetical protein